MKTSLKAILNKSNKTSTKAVEPVVTPIIKEVAPQGLRIVSKGNPKSDDVLEFKAKEQLRSARSDKHEALTHSPFKGLKVA